MKPLGERVILQEIKDGVEIKTTSGFVVKKEVIQTLKKSLVVEIGDEVKKIKKGDYVLVQWIENKFDWNGIELFILKESEIISICKK